MSDSFSWGDSRRFNSHTARLRAELGGRAQKLSVDAGFSCPNRDGSRGVGGCTFCDNSAFNPSYCQAEKSIPQQLLEGKLFHQRRYKRSVTYLAYFQAYSNTYAPLDVLRHRYEEALSLEGIKGLVIGTRPDCVDDEVLDYLKSLSLKHYVSLELGLESCFNSTLKRINRGHSMEESLSAIERAADAGLRPAVHLMLGLPGESEEAMLSEAGILSALPIKALKIHQLQIMKDTVMEKEYLQHPDEFRIFSLEEYIHFVIRFLELLNPSIAIDRLAAEAPPRFLHEVKWGKLRYDQVLQRIENEMERLNTWQGRLFDPSLL